MDKCFCHFNGYEVKDAKSRRDIEVVNENLEVIETDIEGIESNIIGLDIRIKEIVNNQIPEEYLQECIDDYIAENESGLTTKTELKTFEESISKYGGLVVIPAITTAFNFVGGGISEDGTIYDGGEEYNKTHFVSENLMKLQDFIYKFEGLRFENILYKVRIVFYETKAESSMISYTDYLQFNHFDRNTVPNANYIRLVIMNEVNSEFVMNDALVKFSMYKDKNYLLDNNGLFAHQKYSGLQHVELGTAWIEDNVIKYGNVVDKIRTPIGATIHLKKGILIYPNDCRYSIIKVGETNTLLKALSPDNHLIEEDGEYIFIVAYMDLAEIIDINDLRTRLLFIDTNHPDWKNINHNTLTNESKSVICVMHYNVGEWYQGTGVRIPEEKFDSIVGTHRRIFDRYNPDIACMCECPDKLTTLHSANKFLLDKYYPNSAHFPGIDIYSGKCIATRFAMHDTSNYTYQSDFDKCRTLLKTYLYINGRKVCVVSTHFTSFADEDKILEAQELLPIVANEEYAIICLDSNVSLANKESDLYKAVYGLFLDNGFKMCNGGEFGDFITSMDRHGNGNSFDNILVTENINIKSVMVDTQKYTNNDFVDTFDHLPLIAYLEIF